MSSSADLQVEPPLHLPKSLGDEWVVGALILRRAQVSPASRIYLTRGKTETDVERRSGDGGAAPSGSPRNRHISFTASPPTAS